MQRPHWSISCFLVGDLFSLLPSRCSRVKPWTPLPTDSTMMRHRLGTEIQQGERQREVLRGRADCNRCRDTDAGCQNKTVHLRPPSRSCGTRGRSHVTSAPDSEDSNFQHTEIPKTNLCGPDPCVYRPAHVRPCKNAGNQACNFSFLLLLLCSLVFAADAAAASCC